MIASITSTTAAIAIASGLVVAETLNNEPNRTVTAAPVVL